jgi:hypothetical protein
VIVAAGAVTFCVLPGELPSELLRTWRNTISAAFISGVPLAGDPVASEASKNSPELWNACLMSLPVRP